MSEFTVRSHSKTHNVTAQTARNDLMDLHARGFLLKGQIGKEFVFLPIVDLYERLRDGAVSKNTRRDLR
jgi:hypothetical protein